MIIENKYYWTQHSLMKMRYYGLSQQRIKRVVKSPERIEEGIVPDTIACMQKAGSSKHPYEIWTMYQLRREAIYKSQIPNPKENQNYKLKILNSANRKIRIISAWRYPGTSPKNNPIPRDILEEIKSLI